MGGGKRVQEKQEIVVVMESKEERTKTLDRIYQMLKMNPLKYKLNYFEAVRCSKYMMYMMISETTKVRKYGKEGHKMAECKENKSCSVVCSTTLNTRLATLYCHLKLTLRLWWEKY